MANDRLQDVIVSTIFMCGMASLDPDAPCYDLFNCDPYMDFDTTHVESELYYTLPRSRHKISPCVAIALVLSNPRFPCTLISWHKIAVPILSSSLYARSALPVVAIFLPGGGQA